MLVALTLLGCASDVPDARLEWAMPAAGFNLPDRWSDNRGQRLAGIVVELSSIHDIRRLAARHSDNVFAVVER